MLLCGAAPAPSPSGPALTGGLALERELQGGETHVYPVDLQAGQLLRVRIQEEGIDVEVRLLDPTGKVVTGVDTPSLAPTDSLEDLTAVAADAGSRRLEIRSLKKSAPAGRYRLTVPELRPAAGEQDALRSEAVRVTWLVYHPPPGEPNDGQAQVDTLTKAYQLWDRLGDRRMATEELFLLANVRVHLPGGTEQAGKEFLEAALRLEGEEGARARLWQIHAFNSAGTLAKRSGHPEDARQDYERALAIARAVGNPGEESTGLNNLGMLETDQGEIQSGISLLLQSRQKAREAHAIDLEALAVNNLATVYDQLAEQQEALRYHKEGLELARASRSRENESLALNNLGLVYAQLGDGESAVRYLNESLKISRQLGDRRGEAKNLINLGGALSDLSRHDEAAQSFERALRLGRALKDPEIQTYALAGLSLLFTKLGRVNEALAPAREAVRLAQGFPGREVFALLALSTAHREVGDTSAAQEELGKALSLAQKQGDYRMEALIDLELAKAERIGNNPGAALDHARTAVGMIESIRSNVSDQWLRSSFLATEQSFYEVYIDLLVRSGEPETIAEALRVSEQARARSLLDILNESGADTRTGADPALLEREHRLREELKALDSNRLRLLETETADSRQLAQIDRRLETTLADYRELQTELRTSNPEYADLVQPQPLSLPEIQSQVLDGRALLLEYSLGDKRSVLWAVTSDSIHSFALPGREAIERTVRRYYECLTARNALRPGESLQARQLRVDRADAEAGRLGRQLYRILLAPAESLWGDRPLLIVADGALQYIPFSALPMASGNPLVTRHEIVNLPSATALAMLRRERHGRAPAPKALAIIADPVFQADDDRLSRRPARTPAAVTRGGWSPVEDRQREVEKRYTFRRLTASGHEARAIAALVPPGQILLATGFEASRATATSPELAHYRNIHFATHGVLDSRRPELSKLILSLYDKKGRRQDDGFLSLNDIYNLHLDADLVVLSACQTALGKEIRGEGLIGLTRGFMYAGASRVLASLWSIEDRTTAQLMESFYRGMLRRGLSPAAALRQAQLAMAAKPGRKSPYYWAGFSLQGEWQ